MIQSELAADALLNDSDEFAAWHELFNDSIP